MFPKLSNVHYSLLLERYKNQMEVRYFDFQFLDRSKWKLSSRIFYHILLLTVILLNLCKLQSPILIGPFLTTFKEESGSDHPDLVNIASCGLHRIHGAWSVVSRHVVGSWKATKSLLWKSFLLLFWPVRLIKDKRVADPVIMI